MFLQVMADNGGEISGWFMGIVSAVMATILAIVQHISTREKKSGVEQMKEMLELMKMMDELKEAEREKETEKETETERAA